VKTLLALCLLFAITSHATPGLPPEPSSDKARFQIVSGSIDHGGGSVPTFMRVDTFTGQTWLLQQVPLPGGNGAMMHVWVASQEVGSELYNYNVKALVEKSGK
jgi:hypothetical protein